MPDNYLVTKTILGQLVSMKNRRRLVTLPNGKRMSLKSKECEEYERNFMSQLSGADRIGYTKPVSLRARVYYRSSRSDLDIEFLKDLLQKGGVIGNDRQVKHVEAWHGVDKHNPRVIFSIYPWSGDGN